MQNDGEINELKVWIAEELEKLRNELRNDLNALEAKMDAGFRQMNNRIDENQMKINERLTRIEVNIVSLMD